METEEADEYVFLGDYFDNFGDGPSEAKKTATWLRKIIERDDTVCLWGNHDVPYRWCLNRHVSCPGFDHDKSRMIGSIMNFDLWGELKWYYKTQGWYLSHAGFSEQVFGTADRIVEFGDSYIDETISQGMKALDAGLDPRHARMGWRMGIMHDGGLTWMDWNRFQPLLGINQIVGHTPHGSVRVKYLKKWRNGHKAVSVVDHFFKDNSPKPERIASLNYCIDSANRLDGRAYAVIEDGVAEIKRIRFKNS
jgi:hypothetical protein